MNINNVTKNRILAITIGSVLGSVLATNLLSNVAYADCTPNGAYGEDCVYDKRFEIDKDVRFVGDSDWKDKIVGVKEGEKFEFKITIKSNSEVDVDSMKMTDFLPSEIERISGDELVQYWEDFEPGEKKEFTFQAIVRKSEYDRKNFEKCVVNKAESYYSDDIIGSATATVCYTDEEPKELPKTGPVGGGLIGILGLLSIVSGISLRKRI